MKIALLLTGFVRSYLNNFNSLKVNIIDKYNTDIYISTWNKTQSIINSGYDDYDINSFINIYSDKLKDYIILDIDKYYADKINITFQSRSDDIFKINNRAIEHGSRWVERLRDQWYIVNNGFNLISNNYDYIIRTRFDVLINNFNLLPIDFVIPAPHPINVYNDHFAYGNYDNMKIYCDLYSNIEKLYIDYNIDISNAEYMLKFYIENYHKINTYIDSTIKYGILK
jgi:hypothetical protein